MRLKHASPSPAGSAAPIASMRAIAPGTEVTGASGGLGAAGGAPGVGSAADMAVTITSTALTAQGATRPVAADLCVPRGERHGLAGGRGLACWLRVRLRPS